MSSKPSIPSGATTGIGSLPHHNIDAALEYAFRFDIPFLPQIPMRNAWEFALPQGTEGLPGIQVEKDGSVLLDTKVWEGNAASFDQRLSHAFDQVASANAFEAFEPSAATSSSWQPFLWELQERNCHLAKIQIVGPLTAQWTLRTTTGQRMDQASSIGRQVFRLILARALGMTRRLRAQGVQTILFLDEPALFVLSDQNPTHLLGLQELKLLIQALQKEGVSVGLHCCSNTRWELLSTLGLDILSLDTRLSLESLLQAGEWLPAFVERRGRLGLGVIPTSGPARLDSAGALAAAVFARLERGLGPELGREVAENALWTPACGLALHSPKDAEGVYSQLVQARNSVLPC